MKFAIRKIALTCAVPTTFFVGLTTLVQGQEAPTTSQATAVRMIEVRAAATAAPQFLPPRQLPPSLLPADIGSRSVSAAQSRRSAARFSSNVNSGSRPATTVSRPEAYGIRQVANQSVQQQPQQARPAGGESDVQRQLRSLYEKSGQEMPVMDLNELEVPEPQPGVMPEGGVPPVMQQGGGAAPGLAMPQTEAKKPSFFERVFLGKKAPAPQPQMPTPGPQRPLLPGAVVRPPAGPQGGNGQATVPRGGQPGAPNYRPFTPNPPAQPNSAGQRPGSTANTGGVGAPRLNPMLQQRPQVLATDQGGAAQSTPQANPQLPVTQQNESQTLIQQPGQQSPAARKSEIPVLEDEPEESLEIDLTPRTPAAPTVRNPQLPGQQAVRQTPTPQAEKSRVIPAPIPNRPVAETPAPIAEQVENPFTGLQLSIPDQAAQKPVTRTPVAPPTVAQPPVQQLPKQPSQIPVVRSAAVAVPPVAVQSNITNENPFGSETTVFEPVRPPTPQKTGARTIPAIPISQQAAPEDRGNPFLEPPKPVGIPLTWLEDNLRKLAESPEKLGFKGFCPVMLRQHRTLAEVKPQFNSTYRGRKLRFSSAEAKARFEKTPHLFAPAYDGLDGVALLDDEKSLEGSLDHAAWFQGRLYMFTNRVNLELFNAEPEQYMDDSGREATSNKPPQNASTTNSHSGKPSPVARQDTPKSVAKPVVTAKPQAAASAKPAPQKPSTADELPVLLDDPEVDEPTVPAAKLPTVQAPAQSLPGANLNGLRLTVPEAKAKPRTSSVQQPVSPMQAKPAVLPQQGPTLEGPKLEGPKLEEPTLEGPKMQGKKLNDLAAPIKPASGIKTQDSNPAPRLIKPATRVARPQS